MSGKVIKPSHFLSLRPNLMFNEFIDNEHCDPNFVSRLSSASSVLQGWKKGQALVKEFKATWQRYYCITQNFRCNLNFGKQAQKTFQCYFVLGVQEVVPIISSTLRSFYTALRPNESILRILGVTIN